MEVKDKDKLSITDLENALHDHRANWHKAPPHFLQQALDGRIPVREAFRAIAYDGLDLSPKVRMILQNLCQGWTYGIQIGLKYSAIFSGDSGVILRNNYVDDSAHFSTIQLSGISSSINGVGRGLTMVELIVALTLLNKEAGLRDMDDIEALGKRMAEYYLEPSTIVLNPAGPSGEPRPPHPPAVDDEDEGTGDDADSDPSSSQGSTSTPLTSPTLSSMRNDSVLDTTPSTESDEAIRDSKWRELLTKFSTIPENFSLPISIDEAKVILSSAVRAITLGRPDIAEEAVEFLEAHHSIVSQCFPISTCRKRKRPFDPSVTASTNLPPSPPLTDEDSPTLPSSVDQRATKRGRYSDSSQISVAEI